MSKTVDALREIWACLCGAEGRAKQVYGDARRIAIARVGGEDLTDSTGRYLFVEVLFAKRLSDQICGECMNVPWRLQPEAPFTLMKRDERALACLCGAGGERAKQDLKLAQDAYDEETGRIGIAPQRPLCPSLPDGCNAACWYIQPGVEAVVPGVALVQVDCVACGGAGKVTAAPVRQPVIRRYVSVEG